MSKILSDFHVHTCFCDGKNTPEEIVLAAIDAGMKTIGFSGHSHTAFDESYAMSHEAALLYRDTVNGLKEKYSGRIEICCGIEQDRYSDEDTAPFDYVIGSVHYIFKNGEYIPVDETADILAHAAERLYNGDIYALIEDYYKTVSEVALVTNADVIGHFDLITKFIERAKLFDTQNDRYIAAYRRALDCLIPMNIPFEINTGAMSRGYRSEPYPSRQILRDIKALGGTIAISSDSHDCSTLMFAFDKALALARGCGFDKVLVLKNKLAWISTSIIEI